ncbi:MAG: hypothetical protein U1E42_05295 [Rhodospirillales bacterium]
MLLEERPFLDYTFTIKPVTAEALTDLGRSAWRGKLLAQIGILPPDQVDVQAATKVTAEVERFQALRKK